MVLVTCSSGARMMKAAAVKAQPLLRVVHTRNPPASRISTEEQVSLWYRLQKHSAFSTTFTIFPSKVEIVGKNG